MKPVGKVNIIKTSKSFQAFIYSLDTDIISTRNNLENRTVSHQDQSYLCLAISLGASENANITKVHSQLSLHLHHV